MISRPFIASFALLLLAGCTNDTAVQASLVDGGIAFAMPADVKCVDMVSVTHGNREDAWRVGDAANGSRPCVPVRGNSLRYGAALPETKMITPPQPLAAGRIYAMNAGPNYLVAVFRYNGPTVQPTNFKLNSKEGCEVRYPGSKPDWLTGNCII